MICNNCGGTGAVIKQKPMAFDNHGAAVMIRNVPTLICNDCATRVHSDDTFAVIERILKEVETPYTEAVTVDYEKAAEAWKTPA